MKIFNQLIKEFCAPFALAFAWSAYNLYSDPSSNWNITKFINIFGPSFFLASWLTAQYFRVRKQNKVENELLKIQEKTAKMLDELETKTSDLVSHLTGGDSFCYLMIGNLFKSSNVGIFTVVHCGNHVIYDVKARICDLNVPVTAQMSGNSEIHRTFGNLTPGHAISQGSWNLGDGENKNYNIFWNARNGGFVQLLRFRKINDQWYFATKVQRDKVIFEKIQEEYPRNQQGTVDWE
jgi:hypothetical protein